MMVNVGEHAALTDHSVIVEYGLPLSSRRLDIMILGHDAASRPNALVIELKQWKVCKEAEGDHQVRTVIGGRMREVNHPSEQVHGYVEYLLDLHSAFQGTDAIRLTGCGFLLNYHMAGDEILNAAKFSQLLKSYPLFGKEDFDSFATHLNDTIGAGGGEVLLQRIREGRYRPARKLLEHVADVINGKSAYILIDEQRVVYDKIRALVRNGLKRKNKNK